MLFRSTIKFSGTKLFDAFNIGKSIWNLAFDNIHLNIKKNKENISTGRGYVYFFKRENQTLYVWEYEIRKDKKNDVSSKTYITQLYEGTKEKIIIGDIINEKSSWREIEGFDLLPIFEVKSTQEFPMEQTFVPMMKRKLMTYVFQIVNSEIINNFDSQIQL